MTENLPDYATFEVPDGKAPTAYSTHERRAELLRIIRSAGTPHAVTQSRLAERFDVHRSTISRDMDRLRESVADHLGDDAKLTTRVLFEKTVRELQNEGEWKQAWDVVMDWNEWLADLGEQHREPAKSELDVRSRHSEVAYTIVREGDDEPLPTTDDDAGGETVDHEALGFTSSPVGVEVESPEGREG